MTTWRLGYVNITFSTKQHNITVIHRHIKLSITRYDFLLFLHPCFALKTSQFCFNGADVNPYLKNTLSGIAYCDERACISCSFCNSKTVITSSSKVYIFAVGKRKHRKTKNGSQIRIRVISQIIAQLTILHWVRKHHHLYLSTGNSSENGEFDQWNSCFSLCNIYFHSLWGHLLSVMERSWKLSDKILI